MARAGAADAAAIIIITMIIMAAILPVAAMTTLFSQGIFQAIQERARAAVKTATIAATAI